MEEVLGEGGRAGLHQGLECCPEPTTSAPWCSHAVPQARSLRETMSGAASAILGEVPRDDTQHCAYDAICAHIAA